MKLYNINASLIKVIESLYVNASSAVFSNGNLGEWFNVTVGVRQGCLLSPTLFNIFLERIMSDALENFEGSVSIGGRKITNLRFADDIDGLAGSDTELKSLVQKLNDASTAYGMEISAQKTKIMTNNNTRISDQINVNGETLEQVNSFKYLGSTISEKGSKPEILSRAAQTIAAMTKLQPIWKDRNITVTSKIRLMRSLAFSIYLYACETWTLTAELEKKITALEMRCYRKVLHISYKDHITNEEVRNRVIDAIGPHDDPLSTVKRKKNSNGMVMLHGRLECRKPSSRVQFMAPEDKGVSGKCGKITFLNGRG